MDTIHNDLPDPMEAHSYLKNFSIIHRMGVLFHLRSLKAQNISGHQMGFLAYISHHRGISQEQLAQFFHLNKGAVAKGLRHLTEDGYILRKPSRKDKRAYELYPTEQAELLLREAQEVTQAFADILVRGMSAEEQQLFRQLLERAASNVAETMPDGCSCTPHDSDFHFHSTQSKHKKGD